MTGPGKSFFQVPFDEKRFTELLTGPQTYRVAYLRAYLCPNRGERGVGHVPDCPVCRGLGYYWKPMGGPAEQVTRELTRAGLYEDSETLGTVPSQILAIVDEEGVSYPPESVTVGTGGKLEWVEGQPRPADYRLYNVTYEAGGELRALIQGVTTQREFAPRAEYEVQDVQITVDRFLADGQTLNPAWDAGENDRFVLLDTWRRHTQHLQRGVQDSAIYRRMRDVRLTGIQGSKLVEYRAGTDYTVKDGSVQWAEGKGPRPRAYYTLEAQVSPEYYVFQQLPQTRHMDGQDMPRRFVLRGFEKHPSLRPESL